MDRSFNVLIASRSRPALDELEGILGARPMTLTRKFISNGHSDPLHGLDRQPDVLVFCLSDLYEDELGSLRDRPVGERPVTLIIGPQANVNCMRMALQAGARDYLEQPIRAPELLEALDRISRDLQPAAGRPGRDGVLTAVVAAKGGSGGSFLAVNLAHMMATNSEGRVALLDLDLQFGSLAQYLDIKSDTGLMRALEMGEQLDPVALEACMAKHPSGVSLLAPGGEDLILGRDVPVDRLVRILDLLKKGYARVIVDLLRQVDELNAAVYERADRILLVVQQELGNVKDAARLRTILLRDLAVPAERITVVVNRHDKALPIQVDDICKALGVQRGDCLLIPNHYRTVADSINMGVPMLDYARGSTVTKALMDIEARLSGSDREERSTNLLSRAISTLMMRA